MMTITNAAVPKIDFSGTLSKIRSLVGHPNADASLVSESNTSEFDQIISKAKASISEISQADIKADNLRQSYLSGDATVSLAQVAVASMKSKLAFEGLLVVRNKLLEAYKEIMNMPV